MKLTKTKTLISILTAIILLIPIVALASEIEYINTGQNLGTVVSKVEFGDLDSNGVLDAVLPTEVGSSIWLASSKNCESSGDSDLDGVCDDVDADTIYGTVSGDIQEGVTVEIYTPNCGGDILVGNPITNSEGYYAIGDLANGRYLVQPEDTGYSFSNSKWVNIPQTVIQSYDFTSTKLTCDDVDHFLDNGDGTVTDCRTGLIWLKNAGCYGVGPYAVPAALNSGECGLTDGSVEGDWRNPTKEELQELGTDPPETWEGGFPNVSWTKPGEPFVGVAYDGSHPYWSSSYVVNTSRKWFVYMADGLTQEINWEVWCGIWPVRSGN